MLDNITQRLTGVINSLRGKARLTEDNIAETLREVRMALLEADVALPVVKDFISTVREKALGNEVIASLTPGQALVGVVHQELITLMGGETADINLATQPPAVILMAGLQGTGKTTTTAKLGKWLHERHKKKILAVSCDVYRPAAIEQLQLVSKQAGIDFFPSASAQTPLEIATAALDYARKHYFDVLLVDTAGRMGIDEVMMTEISQLHTALEPVETLFVVDAMLGQDAVNIARAFADALPLTGIVLTKLDGDSRGGAALSVKHITGKPLKFTGVGEKLADLEVFHPERMVSRILGMGDVISLVEEAQQNIDLQKAKNLSAKLKTGKGFDLNDFKTQIGQVRNMGGMGNILGKLPAQFNNLAAVQDTGDQAVLRIEGIINSMTPQERTQPELIKASRKRRIASGAGVTVQEVNRLLNQFTQTQKIMKQLSRGGMGKMMRGLQGVLGNNRLPGMRP